MLVSDLVHVMETIAPRHLAEAWDNVGLIVGDERAALRGGVMLTIDLTDAVMEETLGAGCGAIIAYHPPIFEGLKRVTAETRTGRVVLTAARAGIAVYSPHTALDASAGGMTDWLADALGTGERRPIVPRATEGGRVKIVTFVP